MSGLDTKGASGMSHTETVLPVTETELSIAVGEWATASISGSPFLKHCLRNYTKILLESTRLLCKQETREFAFGYLHDAVRFTKNDTLTPEQAKALREGVRIASKEILEDEDLTVISRLMTKAEFEMWPEPNEGLENKE